MIDLPTWKVRMVRAGHPFPIVLRADGRLEEIRTDGYAVGLGPVVDPVEAEISLDKGDRLFLYSDGLTDCTNLQSLPFSRQRLVMLLGEMQGTRMADTVTTVSAEIAAWRGSRSR